ncbi:signal transduction histidine kinase [Rivularia sp. PCC 7116]|uniref:HAMP domain-containing sensor histidine kinase n=1 Tax=Rivularia sp. PCC 7116 TaxID=373994 RepID=UPI00029EDE14|nr:HAMP domain-containing sensor histidine kinase [Rivularia sp. PCC 7116]AFY54984.1 signal transduction histidine kinase [Rivularia sp. PCC 7116]
MSVNSVKNHSQPSDTPAKTAQTALHKWRGLFWATRTRILAWYVLIITFIFLVSIPAFRELLYARVDTRVRRELMEKIQTFNRLIQNEADSKEFSLTESETIQDSDWVNELDNRFVRPSSKKELKDFFNGFLTKQLPEDDTFLITFVDGKFFKSSPRARPKVFDEDSQIMRRWSKLVKPEKGEKDFDSDTGGIIYLSQPVKIKGETLGVLVVAHTIKGERDEVIEAVGVVIQVSSIVICIALLLSWIASGKILAPLRSFSVTARSISESDLSQRIPVRGKDELAEVANTFNEMMDRLEATFTTQRNFINDAGHELRTPITIIRGHLELMDRDDSEEVEETANLVIDELDRMSRFVEDLILLTKAERPDFLQLATVDVENFTQELFVKAQALAERNWCLDNSAKGMVIFDRQRLTQAVMNLAQNAAQHTTNTDTITIGSSIDRGKMKFWVRDMGEGIKDTDKSRIFERFARAANSRRRSEGAGLGLSIVKAIAEAHQGEVTLESRFGKGANFCIILPINS